jgi:hypothetical protein
MDEPIFESAPDDLVSAYRDELRILLLALGRPEAFVTDASTLRDFAWSDVTETRRIDVQSRVGVRLKGDHRLVDIARRMRQLAERQIAAATPAVRHAWVEWLGERDAEVLLLTLMQCIDQGERLESLQQIVDGWRTNALRALAAEDYRADVDQYVEVSVDARLYLLARPDLMRHLEDLEDEADDADTG